MVHRLMRLRITINGHVYEAEVEVLDDAAAVPAAATGAVVAPAAGVMPTPPAPSPAVPARVPATALGSPSGVSRGVEVRAVLPGVVSEVRAVAGQRVAVGDVLLVLEAMKMDNDVAAPVAGTVRAIMVAAGEQVAAQQVLAVLE